MGKTEQIHQQAGSPEGQDAQHWKEAEEQLREDGKLDEFGPPAELPDLPLAPSSEPDTSAAGSTEGNAIEADKNGVSDIPDRG